MNSTPAASGGGRGPAADRAPSDPASAGSMARASVSPTRSATSSGAPPTHDGRVVTVGQLVLFSTETGSSPQVWPAIGIEENDTTFAIGWKGRRRRPVPPQSADRSSVHVPPAPPDPAPPGCACRSPPCIWVRRRGRRSRPARLSRRAHKRTRYFEAVPVVQPTSRPIARLARSSAANSTIRARWRIRYSVLVERTKLSSSTRSSSVKMIQVASGIAPGRRRSQAARCALCV